MSTPITSTATRSGSRVIVSRDDRVLPGHEPLIIVLTDNCDVLTFAPPTAAALGNLLIRASTDVVELDIKVSNSYATGESFTRTMTVDAAAPRDDADLDDWAYEQLFPHTGEGPQYATVEGVYEVEVLRAPDAFSHLVSFRASSAG
ncbi:hypothetical protein [Gordonia cholesterolivorans]|uniref:Uncharacterized protein n=1 Tax=Gordonia cholesterolivorans TaxID=559625 RepID=A0ABN3HCA6_9ACTN